MKPLTLATIGIAVLVAGCGGNSGARTASASNAASKGAPTTAPGTTTGANATRSTSAPATTGGSGPLAFAKCMRANGVPNFPDPGPDGNFSLNGVDPQAPAFQAAQTKCQRLMGGGPLSGGGQGDSPQQKAQALAQLRTVAQCMRQHGVPDFPDPTLNPPRSAGLHPGQYSEITNYMGVFLLFPSTIDMQSPAWNRAAAACGSLAESFNHPHH